MWWNTSCLVVATLRVALEVKGRVVLVDPSKALAYIDGASVRIIDSNNDARQIIGDPRNRDESSTSNRIDM